MRIVMQMLRSVRQFVRRSTRLAAAHREMQMLLRADERALRDIGLTRGDAEAVARCAVMARAAAARRDEAIAAAGRRRAGVVRRGFASDSGETVGVSIDVVRNHAS